MKTKKEHDEWVQAAYGVSVREAVGHSTEKAAKSARITANMANALRPQPYRFARYQPFVTGQRVRVSCMDGSWWSLKKRHRVLHSRVNKQASDVFILEKANKHNWGIKVLKPSGEVTYLSADETGELSCNRPWREGWETFVVLYHGDNVISLRSHMKRYFCLQLTCDISASSLYISPREMFTVETIDDDENEY